MHTKNESAVTMLSNYGEIDLFFTIEYYIVFFFSLFFLPKSKQLWDNFYTRPILLLQGICKRWKQHGRVELDPLKLVLLDELLRRQA